MDSLPQIIGRFSIERACPVPPGEDQAYVAFDPERNERVILQMVAVGPKQSAGAVLFRLKADLEISGRLTHPGLVPVRSLGTDQSLGPYLIREYVNGPSLRALPSMEVDLHAALRILVQAAHALAAADEAGVAPRTLRLEHLHIAPSGQVRLPVFGLVHAEAPSAAASACQLARAGLELIVGAAAFAEASDGEAPRLPAALDKGLAHAFGKALAADPAERFATPAAFMQVLIAEAPLPEEQQRELLERMDGLEPVLEDLVVRAWARSIWRDLESFDAAAAAPAWTAPARTPTPTPAPTPGGGATPAPAEARRVQVAAAPARPAAPRAEIPLAFPPRRGKTGLIVAAVAAVALAAGGLLLLGGRKTVVVRLDSAPPGAQVVLDGRALGATPLQVTDPGRGARAVVSKPGFKPADVAFKEGEGAILVKLEPLPPEPAPAPALVTAPAEPQAAPEAGGVERRGEGGAEPRAEGSGSEPRAEAPAKPRPAAAPKKAAPRPSKGDDKKGFDLFKHLEKQSGGG